MYIELEESKHDELIRLTTKRGWYAGYRGEDMRLPTITAGNNRKGFWDEFAPPEEVDAYKRGYAEGIAAKAAGIPSNKNPYNLENFLRRLQSE